MDLDEEGAGVLDGLAQPPLLEELGVERRCAVMAKLVPCAKLASLALNSCAASTNETKPHKSIKFGTRNTPMNALK